jgi:hypothetical protein
MESMRPYFANFSSYQEKMEKATTFYVNIVLTTGRVISSSPIPMSSQMLDEVSTNMVATTMTGEPFMVWCAHNSELVMIPAAQIEAIHLRFG